MPDTSYRWRVATPQLLKGDGEATPLPRQGPKEFSPRRVIIHALAEAPKVLNFAITKTLHTTSSLEWHLV